MRYFGEIRKHMPSPIMFFSLVGFYVTVFNIFGFIYGYSVYGPIFLKLLLEGDSQLYTTPTSPISAFFLRVLAVYLLTKMILVIYRKFKKQDEQKLFLKGMLAILIFKCVVIVCMELFMGGYGFVSIFFVESKFVLGPYTQGWYELDSRAVLINTLAGILCLMPACYHVHMLERTAHDLNEGEHQ